MSWSLSSVPGVLLGEAHVGDEGERGDTEAAESKFSASRDDGWSKNPESAVGEAMAGLNTGGVVGLRGVSGVVGDVGDVGLVGFSGSSIFLFFFFWKDRGNFFFLNFIMVC